jgi:internalin A
MDIVSSKPSNPKPRSRWFQYSLRTLMVFVTLSAVACSWFAVKMQQVKRQKEAVAAFRDNEYVTNVSYDYEFDDFGNSISSAEPPGPAWLRRILGDDFFVNVFSVEIWGNANARSEHLQYLNQLRILAIHDLDFTGKGLNYIKDLQNLEKLEITFSEITDDSLINLRGLQQLKYLCLSGPISDAGLKHLEGLNQLQYLALLFCDRVTDLGLKHLENLVQLQTLDLTDTGITDTGLNSIRGLTQLQTLSLSGTKITDSGLTRLKNLSQLKELGLENTPITDVGMANLPESLHLETLRLNKTQITDAGLKYLTRWPHLKVLILDDTRITDAGLQYLETLTELANLHLSGTEITDAGLEHLTGLSKLNLMDLENTHVTKQGLRKLQTIFPETKIFQGSSSQTIVLPDNPSPKSQ